MKFREHRRELDESMETAREIESTMTALIETIRTMLKGWHDPEKITPETVKLVPIGHDDRVGWNTYYVTLDGFGLVGMTDGEPKKQ